MYLPNPGRGQASWSEAALGVASRRAKFIPPLEAEGFLWLFCKTPFAETALYPLWENHGFVLDHICHVQTLAPNIINSATTFLAHHLLLRMRLRLQKKPGADTRASQGLTAVFKCARL